MTSQAAVGPAAGMGGDRLIIVMMGAPGAGKGTQAERLAAALELPHISTGELFREMLKSDTPLGRKIKAHTESGGLVPDEDTVKIVEARLAQPDAESGAILDGFPRTVAQAHALDDMLEHAGTSVAAVPYIEVGQDLLLERLTGRRICTLDDQHMYHVVAMPSKQDGICDIDGAELYQRVDDSPDTVRDRLAKQLPPMFEVIDYYADHKVLLPVPGDRPAEEVTAELLRVIRSARSA